MVELALLGSKFAALQVAKDLTVALRCRLRMFGAQLDKEADMFCGIKAW